MEIDRCGIEYATGIRSVDARVLGDPSGSGSGRFSRNGPRIDPCCERVVAGRAVETSGSVATVADVCSDLSLGRSGSVSWLTQRRPTPRAARGHSQGGLHCVRQGGTTGSEHALRFRLSSNPATDLHASAKRCLRATDPLAARSARPPSRSQIPVSSENWLSTCQFVSPAECVGVSKSVLRLTRTRTQCCYDFLRLQSKPNHPSCRTTTQDPCA
jgi:hypothetical protein